MPHAGRYIRQRPASVHADEDPVDEDPPASVGGNDGAVQGAGIRLPDDAVDDRPLAEST